MVALAFALVFSDRLVKFNSNITSTASAAHWVAVWRSEFIFSTWINFCIIMRRVDCSFPFSMCAFFFRSVRAYLCRKVDYPWLSPIRANTSYHEFFIININVCKADAWYEPWPLFEAKANSKSNEASQHSKMKLAIYRWPRDLIHMHRHTSIKINHWLFSYLY